MRIVALYSILSSPSPIVISKAFVPPVVPAGDRKGIFTITNAGQWHIVITDFHHLSS